MTTFSLPDRSVPRVQPLQYPPRKLLGGTGWEVGGASRTQQRQQLSSQNVISTNHQFMSMSHNSTDVNDRFKVLHPNSYENSLNVSAGYPGTMSRADGNSDDVFQRSPSRSSRHLNDPPDESTFKAGSGEVMNNKPSIADGPYMRRRNPESVDRSHREILQMFTNGSNWTLTKELNLKANKAKTNKVNLRESQDQEQQGGLRQDKSEEQQFTPSLQGSVVWRYKQVSLACTIGTTGRGTFEIFAKTYFYISKLGVVSKHLSKPAPWPHRGLHQVGKFLEP